MFLNDFLHRLTNVKATGSNNQYTARCPAHNDTHNSLSVSVAQGKILINCHAGCAPESVVSALGLQMHDLYTERLPQNSDKKEKKIERTYDYKDLNGNIIHQTVRYEPKSFAQRRPDPANPDNWIWNLQGIEPILYNLSAVKAAINEKKPIFIVEGEKDADDLMKIGYVATTCPMGAMKWRSQYAEVLIGADVYIIPDNDQSGQTHCDTICRSLFGIAQSIKIIDLKKEYPELPEKGDFTDFYLIIARQQGNDSAKERFKRAVDNAEDFVLREQDPLAYKKEYINAAAIQVKPVPWLIDNFLVCGGINVFQGMIGNGKSWLTSALAVTVARGGEWLNGNGDYIKVPQGKVLLANYDDDASYTITPRLISCGATQEILKNIEILDRTTCLNIDFTDERLEKIFSEIKPSLAIFDTVQHFIGSVNMNSANETNAALLPLQRIAEKYNTAILLIAHISKYASCSGGVLHSSAWSLGSMAIPGIARMIWTIGEIQNEKYTKGTRGIFCSKSNLLKGAPPTRIFFIDDKKGGVVWRGVDCELSAKDLIPADGARERGRPAVQMNKASDTVMAILDAQNGKILSKDMKKEIDKANITKPTYDRAIKKLKDDSKVTVELINSEWHVLKSKT